MKWSPLLAIFLIICYLREIFMPVDSGIKGAVGVAIILVAVFILDRAVFFLKKKQQE